MRQACREGRLPGRFAGRETRRPAITTGLDGGDPPRPAFAGLAITTGLDGGDPPRPAFAGLAITTGLDGGDPPRPAFAGLAITTKLPRQ
jgi:hypothetical protein